MPARDGTGPLGQGARTGRGMGRGFRWGGGTGRRSIPEISPEEEKTLLEKQKSWLKARIETVEKQLEHLNQPKE